MVVVPAGSAAECGERVAAVHRLPRHHVSYIHDVGIGGVDLDLVEVAVAPPQALVGVREAPALAAVFRAVQPASLGGADHGVHARGSARRRGEPDAAETLCGTWQSSPDLPPAGAAVRGPVESVRRRQGPRAADLPRGLPRGPQHREHGLSVRGIEHEVHRARVLVLVEHFLPRVAAVQGAIHAPLAAGAVRRPERRREHAIGIARIDSDRRDLEPVCQPEMPPGGPAVGGLVDPVAHG